MSELLLLLILGHLLADFLFQTQKIIELKTSQNYPKIFKGLGYHVTIHFITYILLTRGANYLSTKLFFLIVILCTIHYLIDFLKEWMNKEPLIQDSNIHKSLLFILDQLVHLLIIYWGLKFFGYLDYTQKEVFEFIKVLFFEQQVSFSNADKFLAISSIVIVNTYFCAYLLEFLLTPIKPDSSYVDKKTESKKIVTIDSEGVSKEERIVEEIEINNCHEEPQLKIGKYIGMIERIIIIILVVSKSLTGIAFLIAIKALTRFKQFEDKSFAEYYLIGSLLSLLWGIVMGYLIYLIV